MIDVPPGETRPLTRLNVAVFGDESRFPPADGLVQIVATQQRTLYGETQLGRQVAKGLVEEVADNDAHLETHDQAIKDLQDRRIFWLQMGAAVVTVLGVVAQILIALHTAGII